MNPRSIIVTEKDLGRLSALLRAQSEASGRDQEHLHDLQAELARAIVVDAADVPAGVVTMHSRVRVQDVATGESWTYTLVFPHDANIASGRLSILAPLGTALLGYREGDEIEWRMPGGVRRLRILEVTHDAPAATHSGATTAASEPAGSAESSLPA